MRYMSKFNVIQTTRNHVKKCFEDKEEVEDKLLVKFFCKILSDIPGNSCGQLS